MYLSLEQRQLISLLITILGIDNIMSCTACISRIRIKLHNTQLHHEENILLSLGVKGIVYPKNNEIHLIMERNSILYASYIQNIISIFSNKSYYKIFHELKSPQNISSFICKSTEKNSQINIQLTQKTTSLILEEFLVQNSCFLQVNSSELIINGDFNILNNLYIAYLFLDIFILEFFMEYIRKTSLKHFSFSNKQLLLTFYAPQKLEIERWKNLNLNIIQHDNTNTYQVSNLNDSIRSSLKKLLTIQKIKEKD